RRSLRGPAVGPRRRERREGGAPGNRVGQAVPAKRPGRPPLHDAGWASSDTLSAGAFYEQKLLGSVDSGFGTLLAHVAFGVRLTPVPLAPARRTQADVVAGRDGVDDPVQRDGFVYLQVVSGWLAVCHGCSPGWAGPFGPAGLL